MDHSSITLAINGLTINHPRNQLMDHLSITLAINGSSINHTNNGRINQQSHQKIYKNTDYAFAYILSQGWFAVKGYELPLDYRLPSLAMNYPPLDYRLPSLAMHYPPLDYRLPSLAMNYPPLDYRLPSLAMNYL